MRHFPTEWTFRSAILLSPGDRLRQFGEWRVAAAGVRLLRGSHRAETAQAVRLRLLLPDGAPNFPAALLPHAPIPERLAQEPRFLRGRHVGGGQFCVH